MPGSSNSGTALARASLRNTPNVFTSILLALILKGALDAFCTNVSFYKDGTELIGVVRSYPGWGILVIFQLIVFLFTVTRFYWGTVRYQEEVPEAAGTPHLIVGLIGAVFVFSIFYVTGLLVKDPGLFYWSLSVAHLVDLFWFLVAAALLQMPPEILRIWSWYKLFDVLTLVFLLIFMLVAHGWPSVAYLFQGLSLVAVAAIGFWDLRKFWPYYTNKPNWKDMLPNGLRRG